MPKKKNCKKKKPSDRPTISSGSSRSCNDSSPIHHGNKQRTDDKMYIYTVIVKEKNLEEEIKAGSVHSPAKGTETTPSPTRFHSAD